MTTLHRTIVYLCVPLLFLVPCVSFAQLSSSNYSVIRPSFSTAIITDGASSLNFDVNPNTSLIYVYDTTIANTGSHRYRRVLAANTTATTSDTAQSTPVEENETIKETSPVHDEPTSRYDESSDDNNVEHTFDTQYESDVHTKATTTVPKPLLRRTERKDVTIEDLSHASTAKYEKHAATNTNTAVSVLTRAISSFKGFVLGVRYSIKDTTPLPDTETAKYIFTFFLYVIGIGTLFFIIILLKKRNKKDKS